MLTLTEATGCVAQSLTANVRCHKQARTTSEAEIHAPSLVCHQNNSAA